MPVGFDQVTICNMAASHVGSKTTIESIDENHPVAKECKLWYEAARIQTLEDFDWDFARKSSALALHAEAAPTNRWSFRYQIPSDSVSPRVIENPAGPTADAVPYEIENAGDETLSIVTNMEDATLVYTYDVQNVALFSLGFIEALAFQLAYKISYKISGKASLKDRILRDYDRALQIAYASNAVRSVPPEERDASWVRART